MHCPYPRFKHKADRETVDLPRIVPTPNDEQLELLTQLRLRATRRLYLRRMTLRVATHNMGYLEGLIDEHESSDILVVRSLKQIMADLLHRLIALREEEEEADMALEQDLWRQATEQDVIWPRDSPWGMGPSIYSDVTGCLFFLVKLNQYLNKTYGSLPTFHVLRYHDITVSWYHAQILITNMEV